MVWDLRGALLKKQEVETARLLDFEFRLRARTMRLLATRLGCDPAALVWRIAVKADAAIVAGLAEELGRPVEDVHAAWGEAQEEARRMLIAERGDPTPYKLG